ncbi:MAG: hypothetical protein QOJ16_409 [Acidobacteriota bacterium]|nr:hypothetical protein [Acidobacteriota bacterium]
MGLGSSPHPAGTVTKVGRLSSLPGKRPPIRVPCQRTRSRVGESSRGQIGRQSLDLLEVARAVAEEDLLHGSWARLAASSDCSMSSI